MVSFDPGSIAGRRKSSRRRALADADLRIGEECVGRDRQVDGRRALADAAGGVEHRAVARAQPAVELALVAERHAAEMRAVAVDDEPLVLALFHPRLIGLRIAERANVDAAGG